MRENDSLFFSDFLFILLCVLQFHNYKSCEACDLTGSNFTYRGLWKKSVALKTSKNILISLIRIACYTILTPHSSFILNNVNWIDISNAYICEANIRERQTTIYLNQGYTQVFRKIEQNQYTKICFFLTEIIWNK